MSNWLATEMQVKYTYSLLCNQIKYAVTWICHIVLVHMTNDKQQVLVKNNGKFYTSKSVFLFYKLNDYFFC